MSDLSLQRGAARTPEVSGAVLLYGAFLLIGCDSDRPGRLDQGPGYGARAEAAAAAARDAEGDPSRASAPETEAVDPRPAVLFLGTSLTAGLGVDPAESLPSLIQSKLDDAGLGLRVVNAGISGETTAGGLGRADWLLEGDIAALVLELGANDALRGVPPEAVEDNLQAIIDRARDRYPGLPIVIAGMRAPPNMGRAYADAFGEIFPRLAEKNEAALVPFLLVGVAADPDLNQADGIHPTARGHQIMAATVWKAFEPIARKLSNGERTDA